MRVILHTVLILVSAVAGFSIGSALKTRSGSKAPIANAVASATSQFRLAQSKTLNKRAVARRDDSPLATRLEQDLVNCKGVDQLLHWMAALEKAQPSDFPRLAKLARGNPGFWRLVVNRWIEVAPRNLYDTILSISKTGGDLPLGELSWKLFNEWPKRDPEAVIAALSEGDQLGMHNTWRVAAVTALIDTNPERGLELMAQWHIDRYGPRMDGIQKWAAANPEHAAEFALAHPSGYVSELTMQVIGKEWARTDPAAALAFTTSQPGQLSSILAKTVLKEWSGENLSEAAKWLAQTDDSTRARLSPTVIETWAKQDAPAALDWCQENLQGLQLAQAVTGLMKGAVEKDLGGAPPMVSGMDPSPARAEAAGVVARKLFPDFNSGDAAKPDAIAWLQSLDQDSIKRAIEQATTGWSTSDPKSMAKFLSSLSNDAVPPFTDARVARELARNSPREALDWASGLPGSRGIDAGSTAFSEWRSSQPDAAMAWLASLPQTDARRQPFFEAMVHSLAYAPQGAEQLSAMSPTDQAAAQNIISKMTLPDDQRTRLLGAFKPH